MKKYYLTSNPFTLTDIDTQEVQNFNNFDELLEASLEESANVYVFELSKLVRTIANKLIEQGYESLSVTETKDGTIRGTIPTKSFLTMAYKKDDNTDATLIRVRRAAKVQVKFFNAGKLFGNATIADIIKSVGVNEENIGMSLALKGLLEQGHTGWTLSSNALNDLQNRCFGKKNAETGKLEYGRLNFQQVFPILDKEVHEFVMSSFQGGICHFNPKYKGKVIRRGGIQYDVNSMYPSIMEKEMLPKGRPLRFEGKYVRDIKRPLYFQEIKVEKLTLKKDSIPCIKNRNGEGYYTKETNLTLVLNHIDLEMMFDNYVVEGIEYCGGYKFMAAQGLFNNYINHWKEEKIKATENKDAFRRMIAKMMLNSAFGKLATRTDKKSIQYKKNCIGNTSAFVDLKVKEGSSVYAPVGAYITSYGRKKLINVIKENGKKFVYSDTDSIYIKGKKAKGLEIDENKFGAWKNEFVWKKMYIVGKKQYIVKKDDKSLKVVCAGMPKEIVGDIKNFKDFTIGAVFSFNVVGYDAEGYKVNEGRTYELKDEEI